jgi:hypothetical protein
MAWVMRAIRWVGALGVVSLVAGCDPTPRQGHSGTFDVQATMMTNTCGSQVSGSSHLSFQAQLAYNNTGASTWTLPQTGASASGTWTAAPPSFRVTLDQYSMLRQGDARYQLAPCEIHRFDVIDGNVTGVLPDVNATMLDAGANMVMDGASMLVPDAGPTTFAATETIEYGVVDGADCHDFLGVGQGQFLTLPCEITYAMNGTLAGP